MKRKKVFVLVAFLVVAALLSACSLSQQKAPAAGGASKQAEESKGKGPIVIKISNGVNEKHPSYLACKKFEEIVEQKTNGKYDVQVYANAQLGDDVKATTDVRMGNLEMVVTSASPITGLAKDFMVFDLPFIVPSEKAADAVFDGPVGQKIASSLDSKGLHLLAYYENGFRQLTNSVREVKTPADVKGLKIRTMENPMHLSLWRALGANPTPMPFSEVFTAMQQKTIDGQENPIPTIYLQKFYEVQKYLTMTGHIYGPHIMLISGKLWESMSPEDKKIFEEAAAESAKFQRATNREMNRNYVDELRKAGMVVTELTPEQLQAFKDAVQPVYKEYEDRIGKDLIDEFKKTVAAAK